MRRVGIYRENEGPSLSNQKKMTIVPLANSNAVASPYESSEHSCQAIIWLFSVPPSRCLSIRYYV